MELVRGLPHFAAATIAVSVARDVVVPEWQNRKVLGDGVLLSFVHPGREQRLGEGPPYLEGDRFEDGHPVRADHYAWINALVRTPTLTVVVRI